MRVIKLIYKWILFSVIIQVCILTYINFFFLGGRTTIQVSNYQSSEKKTNYNVDVPQGSEMIKVSYDSSLVGCLSGGKLVITDSKSNKEKKTISDDEGPVDYYRWLPDRNMVIHSTTVNGSGYSTVKLGTYDLDSDLEKKTLKIRSLPENSKVTSIELSTLTNIIYVKIKTSETRSRIYKFDIMDNMSYIMRMDASIDIKETNFVDSFIYQDENNNIMIRKARPRSTKRIQLEGKLVLLGVDASDKLYVGSLDSDNKVTKIFTGTPDESLKYTFSELRLKKPADKGDIKVTDEGKIFLVDKTERTIKGVGNSSDYSYKGEFIGIGTNSIITYKGGKVKIESIS